LRHVDASPSPASLIESMRDIGYSLETAVADVIDNSITARASAIELYAMPLEDGYAIGIMDDGHGMTQSELLDAMRPGCLNPLERRAERDLGRFGLGLKTASFSQCRRLTVVTRACGKTSVAVWDLDEVAHANKWIIGVPDTSDDVPWADRLGETGTLVVWQHLDRVVGDLQGVQAAKHFDERISDVAEHLELVFHRFLTGRPWRSKALSVTLNGRPLVPYDPFHSTHSATQKDPAEPIRLGGSEVVVQAFTLPHHNRVSSADWLKYAGPEGYLKNQGFYVYRENRLIIRGTWFGLARQSELTKLARVRIDFPNTLDSAWKIDVRKAFVQTPPPVRAHLRNLVERLTGSSKNVYRHQGTKLVARSTEPTWARVQKDGKISYRVRPEHPVVSTFRGELDTDLQPRFDRVLEFISAAFPSDSLFADMGAHAENLANAELPESVIREAAAALYRSLCSTGIERQLVRKAVLAGEPFRSNSRLVNAVLDELMEGAD
jgi:hypothetical protein